MPLSPHNFLLRPFRWLARLPGWARVAGPVVAGLVAAVVLAWWQPWQRAPVVPPAGVPAEDPRLTYPTRFRNVRPDIAYTGDTRCIECHNEAATYPSHPMGRSFATTALTADTARYDAAAHNPFDRSDLVYQIERRGKQVVHTVHRRAADGRELYAIENEVAYTLGSGARGRSLLVNHDGYLFQSPISWYTQADRWDLAPGYGPDRLFDRAIVPKCLFCHCNDARPVEGTRNRYEQPLVGAHAIGCERCHGPAELHLKEREFGQKVELPDDTIVNPARLPPALRDGVCEQCHLQGASRVVRRGREVFDYRPGLPLHLFWSFFIEPPEQTNHYKAVGHVEQMCSSRCYQKSAGQLGCISCHDPHQLPEPAQRVAYYRDRCLHCHGEARTAPPPPPPCKQGGDDNCIRCHMPRLHDTDIVHTAMTDHRVLRPDKSGEGMSDLGPPSRPRQPSLLHFHAGQVDPQDPEVARDLGIALVEQASFKPQASVPLLDQALPRLKEALQRAPDDVPAQVTLGVALMSLRRPRESLEAFETVLARMPNHEEALYGAANAALARNEFEAAESYLQRVVVVNPWVTDYRALLAFVLSRREKWGPALEECRTALRLNPANFEMRKLLITCLLHSGDPKQAEAEYKKALEAFSDRAGELQDVWNARQ